MQTSLTLTYLNFFTVIAAKTVFLPILCILIENSTYNE